MPSRKSRRRSGPFLAFLALIVATVAARTVWIEWNEHQFSSVTSQILEKIEQSLVASKRISDEEIRAALANHPKVVFFSFDNELERDVRGFVNTALLPSVPALATYHQNHTKEQTLAALAHSSKDFESSFLRIDRRDVFHTMKNQKVRVGDLSIGFLRPGNVSFYKNPGEYYQQFFHAWVIFLMSNAFLFSLYEGFRNRKRKKPPQRDEIEWLENKLERAVVPDSIQDDLTQERVISGPGWTDLFNGIDLRDWTVKGQWYVKDECAVGFPWGGSIVTKYEIPFEEYEYEIEAQRLTGPEGFSVLFQCAGIQYVWMIGGWKNTRSEVIGFPSTVTTDKLEANRWYLIKIESDAHKLQGFLDGKKIWEIKRGEQPQNMPDLPFQSGFGVGVWSNLSKFQKIRVVSSQAKAQF